MAVSERLRAFLDEAKVPYTVMKHPTVYTAQEIAAAQHVPGRQLAKSVLVNTDRGPALAVLPAIYRISLKLLKGATGAKTLTIAKESDIKAAFPDVEVGAMSPFGTLYQVPVVAERSLESEESLVFNAGSHTETVKMRTRDFLALVKPQVAAFGEHVSGPPTKKKKRAVAKHASSKKRTQATSRPRARKRVAKRATAKGARR